MANHRTEASGGAVAEPAGWEEEEERLAARSYADGDPSGWFDELYAAGSAGRVPLPWNRTHPHPLLAEWVTAGRIDGTGRRALVVGCGLGADAAYLAGRGFAVVGFDIAPTAIRLASRRWPDAAARFVVADILSPPDEWAAAFDLVVEIITVQAIPDARRPPAIANIGRAVAAGGTLLVIAAVHDAAVPAGPTGPWPLRREEIDAFAAVGLEPVRVEIVPAPGQPGELRWRAEFIRPPGAR